MLSLTVQKATPPPSMTEQVLESTSSTHGTSNIFTVDGADYVYSEAPLGLEVIVPTVDLHRSPEIVEYCVLGGPNKLSAYSSLYALKCFCAVFFTSVVFFRLISGLFSIL